MQYIIGAALLIAILYGGLQFLANINPRNLARVGRYIIGAALVLIGGFMSLRGSLWFGIPLATAGIAALTRGRIGPFDLGGGTKTAGKTSSVRSRFVQAELDHDSGRLTGRVTEGSYAGRVLDDLNETDLRLLLREASVDPDSAALVEAYLDRRFATWREDRQEDTGARPGGSPDAGAMTDEEAYQILGLPAGAGETEIRAAHRRLLKGVHPDRGGSTFLAIRINQAKDRLLSRHRSNS